MPPALSRRPLSRSCRLASTVPQPSAKKRIPMKYESISTMARDWSHEFMSGMKNLEGGPVVDDLHEMAKTQPGAMVTINWIPATHEELFKFPPRVRKYALAYRQGLEEHVQSHAIDAAALLAFRTEVFVAENLRIYVRSYVLDDRHKEHIVFVHS